MKMENRYGIFIMTGIPGEKQLSTNIFNWLTIKEKNATMNHGNFEL